jgi:hypothetical protein
VTSSILLQSGNGLEVGLVERMVVGAISARGGYMSMPFDLEMRERNGVVEARCKEVDGLHVMLLYADVGIAVYRGPR